MNRKEFDKICLDAVSQAKKVISEMKAGKRETGIEFSDEMLEGKSTIKEMIGTDDAAAEFVQKVTYDLYQGRESVPLLYQPIYTTLVDANFPKTLEVNEMGPVSVIFLEHLEGGEVKFGTLEPGTQKTISFVTYAAGVEYDEDILEYNQTWKVSEIGLAYGEAYNKLLNHIHLYPFIAGTYATSSADIGIQKQYQEGTGGYTATAQLIAFATDIETTLGNAIRVLPRGVYMLINSADRNRVEDAIAGAMYDDYAPAVLKRKLSAANIVEYDGEEVVVGSKTYTYTGVTPGELFLIVPKKMQKEYVKHDLRLDSGDGDLSRLVITQMVGRARRSLATTLSGKWGAVKVALE